MFNIFKAANIVATPIISPQGKNSIIWPHTSNDNYIVKSKYTISMIERDKECTSQESHSSQTSSNL